MLLPNKNLDTITLFNYYSTALDYRQHSALKIRVKPRQALASVNTKLLEQRASRTEQHRATPPPIYILGDEKRLASNFSRLSSGRGERENSAVARKKQDESAVIMLGKDGFRPSTVKRQASSKKSSNIANENSTTSPRPITTTGGTTTIATPKQQKSLTGKDIRVKETVLLPDDEKILRRAKTDLSENIVKILNNKSK